MKKYIVLLISFIAISISSFSQTFEMRTYLNDYGYIAVQLRQTALGGQPNPLSSADGISGLVFTVKWAQNLGNVDVDVICTNYNITESGSRSTKETYYYQQFGCSAALICPDDYVLNEWETIATINSTIASGSTDGTFELAENGWAGNLLVTIDWDALGSSTGYYPTLVTGACDDTPIPTIVYDLVWTGAGSPTAFQNENSWSLAGNWSDECGGTGSAPSAASNCFIPSGLTNYPENFYSALVPGSTAPANNVRIQSGGSINFGIQATASELLNISGSLFVYGTLTINPDAGVTVGGDTYIDGDEDIVVKADVNGVGSFIDDGISYGASGSAKVQTFLNNDATGENFWMHMIGPTVNNATLGDFDLTTLGTYAYEYDQPNNEWDNIWETSTSIPLCKGIALSVEGSQGDKTINMSGPLATGDQTRSLGYTGTQTDHYDVISNPYPSSIDFYDFATSSSSPNNAAIIENKYWAYNGSNGGGNWTSWAGGTENRNIQVGQAVFVQVKSPGGNVTFNNTFREHSDDPFRGYENNFLKINTYGGPVSFSDELTIRFDENATTGYDDAIETKKWNSWHEDATMIRSIADDGTELQINVLPTSSLYGKDQVSIPVHFQCGHDGTYTFEASSIETFEPNTEIWLEDKLIGGSWIDFVSSPTYVFSATPEDLKDRFIVHFFGPTTIVEDVANMESTIDIYSFRENVFVRNNTNEIIKSIKVYNLSGILIHDIQSADQRLNEIWVSDKMGYYVVIVATDQNVHNKKIFISK